jgi:hypothetical protein
VVTSKVKMKLSEMERKASRAKRGKENIRRST